MDNVTVCVAGICQGGIIALCDMMVSTGEFGADGWALKFRNVHPQWNAFFAGNDITRIIPLIAKAGSIIENAGTHSLPVVTAAVRDAFTEQLIEKQTELVLARYGLNMSDFVRTGPATFGEQVFISMKYQIDAINLDCVLLVLGFDEDSRAHIFTVEEPGVICNHDLSGFWAIGSGANRALSSLFFRNTVHP